MKRKVYCFVFILLMYGLGGCVRKTEGIIGYQVNYKSEDGYKLTESNYVPEAEEGDALVQELLDKIQDPSGTSMISCMPKEVSVLGFQLKDQHLVLNLNKKYQEMDQISQVLLRAAIVRTFVQMPEILDVSFEIEGKAMLDKKGDEIGPLDASAFIDGEGEGINSYQFAALTLYFSNQEGDRIVKEMRNVYYSSNTTLEKVVMEQLQSGPVNEQLYSVIPDKTQIIDISIKKNECTINFDKEFNQEIPNVRTTPKAVIYAIVNTLCDVCDVSKVRILIDGDSKVLYRDEIDLSEPFTRNKNMILTMENTKETQKETEGKTKEEERNMEPSLGVDPILKKNSETSKKGE